MIRDFFVTRFDMSRLRSWNLSAKAAFVQNEPMGTPPLPA